MPTPPHWQNQAFRVRAPNFMKACPECETMVFIPKLFCPNQECGVELNPPPDKFLRELREGTYRSPLKTKEG